MEVHKEYVAGFTLTVNSSPSEVIQSLIYGSDSYGAVKRVYTLQNGKEITHWTPLSVREPEYIPEIIEQTLEEEIAFMSMFEHDDWWVA